MADSIKIIIVGDAALERQLRRMATFITSDALKSIFHDAANALVAVAQRLAPKRDFVLMNSIMARVEDFGTQNPKIRFGARAGHAAPQEDGAKGHTIFPRQKKFLHWGYRGRKRVSVPLGIDIPKGVSQVFSRGVFHPGNPAKPFFNPAIAKVRPVFLSAIKRALREAMKSSKGE